jgi:hypothetical protein
LVEQLRSQRGPAVGLTLSTLLDHLPDLQPETAQYASTLRSDPNIDDIPSIFSPASAKSRDQGANLRDILSAVEAAYQTHPHAGFTKVAIGVACRVLTCVQAGIDIDIGHAFFEANNRHLGSTIGTVD